MTNIGNIVSHVTRTLLAFNEKYPDLVVEYEVGPYPSMREKLEQDKLAFFPLEDPDTEGADVAIAWKNEKYARKAKNIAQMMEQI